MKSIKFVFAFLLFATSNIYAQQPCDVYVDNSSNCAVNIRMMLYDWQTGGPCMGNAYCNGMNGIIHTTSYVSVPANTTGMLAFSGGSVPVGQWGIVEMDDPDGSGGEETAGDCNNDYYGCTCNTNSMNISLTKTSTHIQVSIW